jgi:hypothetical protein
MGKGSLDAASIYFSGFGERGKTTFHGEGVRVKPVEQGGFAENASIRILRGMDMGIWEESARLGERRGQYKPMNPGKKNCPCLAVRTVTSPRDQPS